MPTYNGEDWIRESLLSVFRQTHPPIEIIVVDDASTDSTAERVRKLAQNAPVPIRLVSRETNLGSPVPAMNVGIAQASGEFVAVIDQDDVFLPQKLEQQARALATNADMAFVFSLFCRCERRASLRSLIAARMRARRIRRRMSRHGDLLLCDGSIALEELSRSTANFFGGFPGFLFRRSAWQQKGGLDERLRIAADFDFLCWLCMHGSVGFIPDVHYWRREHGANLTLSTGIRWRLEAIGVLLGYPDSLDSAVSSRVIRESIQHHLWAVARRLASGGHRQASRDVQATLRELPRPGWRTTIERLAIPAYVVYCRLAGRPWEIPAEQAHEATALAQRVARRLA